jgi:hypothetical protein
VIAWWGWVLLWTGLVLVLVGVLVGCAWWLFRKSLVLLDDLGHLAERASVLEVDEPTLVRPIPAVLRPLSAVQRREDERQRHRTERREERRQARLDRARRITRTDPLSLAVPEEWRR